MTESVAEECPQQASDESDQSCQYIPNFICGLPPLARLTLGGVLAGLILAAIWAAGDLILAGANMITGCCSSTPYLKVSCQKRIQADPKLPTRKLAISTRIGGEQHPEVGNIHLTLKNHSSNEAQSPFLELSLPHKSPLRISHFGVIFGNDEVSRWWRGFHESTKEGDDLQGDEYLFSPLDAEQGKGYSLTLSDLAKNKKIHILLRLVNIQGSQKNLLSNLSTKTNSQHLEIKRWHFVLRVQRGQLTCIPSEENSWINFLG